MQRGLRVTLVERAGQVMATLDEDMAAHVQDAAEGVGIDVRLGAELQEVDRGRRARRRRGAARRPRRDGDRRAPGDGARARRPGLELGDSGALRVDDHQRCPGHDGVFAAGDCVESWHRVLERPMNVQLGTHANKQGRIAGANATGADLAFPGVIGTAASKICRYEVARTGITEREAADAGHRGRARRRSRTARARATTRAAGRSGSSSSSRPTGACSAARSSASRARPSASTSSPRASGPAWRSTSSSCIDLSYAPPYSGVYDPVLVAARAAAKAL